jgi:hypothetical protein
MNATDVSSSGYAKIWSNNPISIRTQADAVVYSFVTTTAVTAEVIMIGLYIFFHQKVIAFLNSKKLPTYYAFWGAQVLVIVLLIIALPVYLSTVQHNIAIAPYFYLLTLSIDFSAAFILSLVLNAKSKFLPVPFSSWLCCKRFSANEFKKCSCLYIYQWLLNLIGLTMTLFFTSYVMQSLPNVLIAYYAYPSRTLLRLSFIQLALISLLITLAGLLYLLEKIGWLCYARCRESTPPDIGEQDYESVFEMKLKDITCDKLSKTGVCKLACEKIICQIITISFTLIALLIMLVLIGTITFKLAMEDSEFLEAIVSILPTFLGNVIIFVNRKKFFHILVTDLY